MGLKIKMVKINGVERVPPKVMAILMRFGAHCKKCARCEELKRGKGTYCAVGETIMRELGHCPEVTEYNEKPT